MWGTFVSFGLLQNGLGFDINRGNLVLVPPMVVQIELAIVRALVAKKI